MIFVSEAQVYILNKLKIISKKSLWYINDLNLKVNFIFILMRLEKKIQKTEFEKSAVGNKGAIRIRQPRLDNSSIFEQPHFYKS